MAQLEEHFPNIQRQCCDEAGTIVMFPLIGQAEIGVKVRYVRLDANTAVSFPFESTKTRRSRAYFHLYESGDCQSNYGVSDGNYG